MAARRLIIILVLLLVASVVAASLAPDRQGRLAADDEEAASTPETDAEPAVGAGETIGDAHEAQIDASVKKPATVEGLVGDQLTLEVGSDPARTITIESFGLSEFAGPGAPARFDLLLREPGTFPITDAADPATIVGRLVIEEPRELRQEPGNDEDREGRGRGSGGTAEGRAA